MISNYESTPFLRKMSSRYIQKNTAKEIMRTDPKAKALRRELGSLNKCIESRTTESGDEMDVGDVEGYEYAYLVSLTELKDLCYPKTQTPEPSPAQSDPWLIGPRGGKYRLINGRKVYARS